MESAWGLELSRELADAVATAAAWRGITPDRYAHEVLDRATRLDAELAAAIKEGEDDLAAGRFLTQEEVEAKFGVRRDQRQAA